MADFQQYMPVRFVPDDEYPGPGYFGGPVTISTDSTVIFRGEEIKITEIEDYVSRMESELMESYITSNEAYANEISNLKRAYEHEITTLQETVAMFEATLAETRRGD